MDVWPAARRFSWDCLARSLRCWTPSSHSSNSSGPNRSRGKITHHSVHLGPGDQGHLPPQSCCKVSRKAPASRHMVMW